MAANLQGERAHCSVDPRFSYLRLTRQNTPRDKGFGRGGDFARERFPIEQIKKWAADGGNLGVRTGRQSSCFVLDVDPRNGGDDSLRALVEEHGPLPTTYTVQSGGGGTHYYFRLPDDFEVRSDNSGLVGDGLDIKGEHSYVVAPGSTHRSGCRYSILNESPIAHAPPFLLNRLRSRAKAQCERKADRVQVSPAKADLVEACCEATVERAISALTKVMDDLAKLGEGRRLLIAGRQRGWDDGFYLLAARLASIASWPHTRLTVEAAKDVFLAHAPECQGTFNPEHKWNDGVASAEAWHVGWKHRTYDHVTVLRDSNGHPISAADRHASHRTVVDDWRPIDLGPHLDGADNRPRPAYGLRSGDQAAMFYPGRVNAIFAEPESGKSWVALAVLAERMLVGESVAFIDYEDDASSAVARLRVLGVPDDVIRSRLRYVNPEGIHREGALALADGCTVVVIDATTEAMSAEGLNDNASVDVAQFYAALPKLLARTGPAVLLIDHVTKSWEGQNQQAGSQHKRAGIDGVSIKVESVHPLAPGGEGWSRLIVTKDRNGGVRQNSLRIGTSRNAQFADFSLLDGGGWMFSEPLPITVLSEEARRAAKVAHLESEVVRVVGKVQTPLRSVRQVQLAVRADGVKFTAGDIDRAFLKSLVERGFLTPDFGFAKAYVSDGQEAK